MAATVLSPGRRTDPVEQNGNLRGAGEEVFVLAFGRGWLSGIRDLHVRTRGDGRWVSRARPRSAHCRLRTQREGVSRRGHGRASCVALRARPRGTAPLPACPADGFLSATGSVPDRLVEGAGRGARRRTAQAFRGRRRTGVPSRSA